MTSKNPPRPAPSMTHHKKSGRARVRLGGRDFYLGPWDSDEANAEYARVIKEWRANGVVSRSATARQTAGDSGASIAEVIVAYIKAHQRGDDDRSFQGSVLPALRRLRVAYGHTPASAFTPARLDAVVAAAVDERDESGRRLSRVYLNQKLIPRIKRLFKWAARKGMVDPSVYLALSVVEGLEAGKTEAPEREAVRPVDDALVDATMPLLPPVVADLLRVQRLTGARPGEVCAMQWGMIDRTGAEWVCRFAKHKTAHKGKSRQVWIGKEAQKVMMKYLGRPTDEPIFSPADCGEKLRARARAARRSKVTPSQAARDAARASKPERKYAAGYNSNSLGTAIRRAVDRRARDEAAARVAVPGAERDALVAALVAEYHWAPNRLRHTYATEVGNEFGIEAASVSLGHSKMDTTQVYAEKNQALARKVASARG